MPEAGRIGLGLGALAVGEQPGERPLPARSQRDQPVGRARRARRTATCGSSSTGRSRCAIEPAGTDCHSRPRPSRAAPASRSRPPAPISAGRATASIAPMIGCTPLAKQASLNGIARIEPVAVGQRDRREAELGRLLGDRLGLDRAFEHGEARKDAKRDVRRGHTASLWASAAEIAKHAAPTYPQLIASAASAFGHDVARSRASRPR